MASICSSVLCIPLYTKRLETSYAIFSPVKLRGVSSYLVGSAFLFVIRPSQDYGGGGGGGEGTGGSKWDFL